jgi:two-component system, OmpR family, sensor kinase
MTLRARLTLALVALLALGLIVADVATYTALRSFLLQRVDQQLAAARVPAAIALNDELSGGEPHPPAPGGEAALPSGTYVAFIDGSGTLHDKVFSYGGPEPSRPHLPEVLGTEPFTTGAVAAGGPRYRVQATQVSNGVLVVGIPLTEVTQTLRRLVVVALLVTGAVVAAMALISWATVRRGLRPLEEIGDTAGAIAGGDLSKRVDETDPRTEVGRLGISLNGMLGRIEEAMDERRASEEALRRFLADASHELRTPLTSIRGYAELFRRGAEKDPADTAVAMRRIEQESERMGLLVDDLLFLARSGRGRPIAHDPVDLARVAADAVHDARAIDPSRAITLEGPEHLVVAGDDRRLRQVFANLLGNALSYSPAGTPVAVTVREEAGGMAAVEVADRGPGLSPEDAAHVFDPFYRADPSRGRAGDEGEGTGLGLAIVAAIADAHGGEVAVTTAPGAGASFITLIPMMSTLPKPVQSASDQPNPQPSSERRTVDQAPDTQP